MKKRLCIGLLATALFFLPQSAICSPKAVPRPIEFLPENIFSVSYQLNWKTDDEVFKSGFKRESILQNKLSKSGLDSDSASGSISYQSLIQYVTLRYGWSPGLNIGISVPYLSRERKSDLTALKQEGTGFVSDNGDLRTSGMGDVEIWGLWRLVYSDMTDFHLGASLSADTGTYSYDEREALSLGKGAREISIFLKWRLYSAESDWMADIKAMGTIVQSAERTDSDGQEYSLSRANGFSGMLSLSKSHDELYFGGGLVMENRGETAINDSGQKDARLSYSYQLFLNYSNLFLLEQSPISLPWEIQVVWEQVISGGDAPQSKTIALGAVAYF